MEDDDDGPISVLPPEVLQHVFSFLPTKELCAAADVCREWRAVSRLASLWRHRDVVVADVGGELFLKIMEIAPELASVTLGTGDQAPGYSEDVAEDVAEDVTEDVAENSSGEPQPPLRPTRLLCPRVRALRVERRAHHATHRGPYSALARALLRRYSPVAETLRAGSTEGLTLEILLAVSRARRLRALQVAGSIKLGARVSDLQQAVRDCAGPLEDLDLEHLEPFKGIEWEHVSYQVAVSKPIHASALVDAFVEAKGATLKRLILPHPRNAVVMDDVLDKMAARCPLLESLGADFYDGARILKSFPRLRHLRLWWSLRTPDREDIADLENAVEDGVEDTAPLARVEHLELDVGSQSANLDYSIALVRCCPRLRVLQLAVEHVEYGRVGELALAAGKLVTQLQMRIFYTNYQVAVVAENVAATVFPVMPQLVELDVNGVVLRRK